jgi:predicted MPP superfamily phosphohydrolase
MAFFYPTHQDVDRNVARRGISRRKFLKAGLAGVGALGFYAFDVERHWAEVKHVEVFIPMLPPQFEGWRVVQLSDIHLEEYTEAAFLDYVVWRINQLRPDVIFLTGDYVSNGPWSWNFSLKMAWECARILDKLHCRERYAVLGNHDVIVGPALVMEALRSHGMTVLDNAHTAVERDGGRIWLAGVDDPVAGDPNPEKAIPVSIRGQILEPVVLLCHAPDYADELLGTSAGQAVSLMLSGHTHGGQVRMPFVGPITLPPGGKKYVEGLFHLEQMQLYVNRGIGTVGLPFRFDCPPEITVLTFRQG